MTWYSSCEIQLLVSNKSGQVVHTCVLRWRHLVNAYGVISLVRPIAAA